MKLVCVLADTTWAIGRVHQTIADAFAGEYEFVFHRDSCYYPHLLAADFERCDIFLTLFELFEGLMSNFLKGKDLRKVLFIAHGFLDWTFIKEHSFSQGPHYCTISNSVTESFPAPIRWTPSGINPRAFEYTPRSGKIQKMGWCGAVFPEGDSKRVSWSYKIAEKAGIDLSIASKLPFSEMNSWYHSIDVFVVTAGPYVHTETGPLPPFEAVLCGVPVIGTRVGNFRLLPGPKFSTIEEAVAILEDLKAHPEKAVALAKEQYEDVIANWTVTAVLPRWRETFEAVINSEPKLIGSLDLQRL